MAPRTTTRKDGTAPAMGAPSPDASAPALVALEAADTMLDTLLQKVRSNGGALPAGAEVELKTLAGTLITLAGGPTSNDDAGVPALEGEQKMITPAPTTKRSMTMKAFTAWSLMQLQIAKGEPRELMAKRLVHIHKVGVQVRKSNFEQAGAESKPIEVDMETAFVGDGLPGTPEDLTTKADQSSTEAGPGSMDTNTGDSQDSAMAQNAAETIGKAVTSLLSQLGYGADGTPGTPSAARTDGATALSKSEGFVWPVDLNAGAEIDTNTPVTIGKRAPSDDLDFGADPGTPAAARFTL
jgi:hypothetical protein